MLLDIEKKAPANDLPVLMQSVVADLFAAHLYLKQHHWMVVGRNFRDIHVFFDEMTDHVLGVLDGFGERTVAMGVVPPTGPRAVSDLTTLPVVAADAKESDSLLAHALAVANKLVARLKDVAEAAHNKREFGIEQLAGDAIVTFEKDVYKLQQYLA